MQKDCSLMKGEKTASQNKDDGTHLPSQQKEQPTNFFERFLVEENKPEDNRNLNSDSLQEVDLNLSLCLGSVDKENSTLTRSSSIAGVMSSKGDSNEPEKSFLSLERSCSLPIDAEQLQRMIHLRELRTMRKDMPKKWLVGDKAKEKSPVPPKVAAWPPASSFRLTPASSTNFHVKEEHVSQTVTVTGLEGSATANATSSFKSLSEPRKDGPVITLGTNSNEKLLKPLKTETGNPFKKPRISYGNFEDNGMEIMRQMPSVSTTGDGPNGRKVEGFLYRYMKGNVSIMCVCHGSFLSPAEFVKHAGGKDVPNPMKHITVYSTFSV